MSRDLPPGQALELEVLRVLEHTRQTALLQN